MAGPDSRVPFLSGIGPGPRPNLDGGSAAADPGRSTTGGTRPPMVSAATDPLLGIPFGAVKLGRAADDAETVHLASSGLGLLPMETLVGGFFPVEIVRGTWLDAAKIPSLVDDVTADLPATFPPDLLAILVASFPFGDVLAPAAGLRSRKGLCDR